MPIAKLLDGKRIDLIQNDITLTDPDPGLTAMRLSSSGDVYTRPHGGTESVIGGGASPFPDVVINVPNDFATVEAALASITGNSASKRYSILLSPGVYPENNPLQGGSYITIDAVGGAGSVVIEASNANQDLFIGANIFGLYNLNLKGVVGAANYAVNMSDTGNVNITNVSIIDCSNGIRVANAAGGIFARRISAVAIVGAIGDLIVVNAGSFNGVDIDVADESTVNTVLRVDGADANAVINILHTHSANVTNGIVCDNEAYAILRGATINNATIGVTFGGGSDVRLISSSVLNCDVGMSIPDGDTVVGMSDVSFDGNVQDVNVASSTCKIFGTVTASIASASFSTGAQINTVVLDLFEGDEGLNILGELHVGTPEHPTESVFGGGDSYTRGMKVYTFDGSAYVDVSDEAGSSSGSTFTFPNVNANTAVYVASSLSNGGVLHHYGLKASITAGAVLGAGSIAAEYWTGAAWVAFTHMTTQSGGHYLPLADKIFEDSGSFQIRNNIFMPDDWATNDDPSYGTSLYWVRYRIETGITTAPVFEQFKLHTERAEINADGYIEFMGGGRPFSRFPWDAGLLEAAASSPANQDLYLSDNLDVGRVENKFNNGATDRIGFLSAVPDALDSSTPIVFAWSVITDDATAGDIFWVLRWGWNGPTDNVYRSQADAPEASPNEQSLTIVEAAPVSEDTVQWYRAELDISGIIPRRLDGFPDTIWVSLQRSGGIAGDTHGGDVSLVSLTSAYLTWCVGGHV